MNMSVRANTPGIQNLPMKSPSAGAANLPMVGEGSLPTSLLFRNPTSKATLSPAFAQSTKIPKGVPKSIDRVLPNWKPINDDPKGTSLINTVKTLTKTAVTANVNTFDYSKYAKDLSRAESSFSKLITTDVQKQAFAAAMKQARAALPGKEAAPPDLPVARNASTDDKNPASATQGAKAARQNANQAAARGDLVDLTPRKAGNTTAFDGNSSFKRVVGTANSNALPVYQLADKPNSYVMPIDLSKVSLVPTAVRSTNGGSTPTSKQPNPLYKNDSVADFSADASKGKNVGLGTDPSKFLGAFNSAFFNSYGPETSISYASLVAGKVTSTGKVEPGNKLLVSWDNYSQKASIKPWSANTSGGFPPAEGSNKPTLASPRAVGRGFGQSVGNSNASGFVGVDAKTAEDKSERSTFVGINKAGRMAVLVAGDNMTPKEAVAKLNEVGFGVQVVKLDSGPSSQLSLATTRRHSKEALEAYRNHYGTEPVVGPTRDVETMVGSPISRKTPMTIGIVAK